MLWIDRYVFRHIVAVRCVFWHIVFARTKYIVRAFIAIVTFLVLLPRCVELPTIIAVVFVIIRLLTSCTFM